MANVSSACFQALSLFAGYDLFSVPRSQGFSADHLPEGLLPKQKDLFVNTLSVAASQTPGHPTYIKPVTMKSSKHSELHRQTRVSDWFP